MAIMTQTAHVTTIRPATNLSPARAAIVRVDEATGVDRTDVIVTLAQDGTDFRGESSGLPGGAQRLGLVATATLEAVHEMTKGKTGYRLVDFATTRAGGADIALAVVLDPDDVDHPLVGTAVIERDNRHVAAARATLDAINRRLDAI